VPAMPPTIAPGVARPSWLDHEVYPYELHELGTGDERIAFTDVGDGPALLFVHVGMWSFLWRDLIAELSRTHRCVALDAPATGASGGRPARHASLAAAAAAVTRVVEHLDLRDLTLVVHDLGGPAAFIAAADWPERVAGLVAVNTFGWRPAGALFRGMLAVMGSAPVRGADVATGFLPRLASGRFGVGRRLGRPARRAFRRGVDRRGRSSFHRYLRDARRGDFAAVDRGVELLRTRPVLTVFGARNDPLRFQPRWQQLCSDIRQVEVPKGNHFPMCDDPSLVAAEIRAWDGRAGRPGE